MSSALSDSAPKSSVRHDRTHSRQGLRASILDTPPPRTRVQSSNQCPRMAERRRASDFALEPPPSAVQLSQPVSLFRVERSVQALEVSDVDVTCQKSTCCMHLQRPIAEVLLWEMPAGAWSSQALSY